MSKIRFVGLDVHAETIAVAVAEPDGEVRSLGAIPNGLESVRKMIGKPGTTGKLKCCYKPDRRATSSTGSLRGGEWRVKRSRRRWFRLRRETG